MSTFDSPADYTFTIQQLKDILRHKKVDNEKQLEGLKFVINGNDIRFESASVIRTIDTIADAFSMNINIETDKSILYLIKPFGYENVEVYLDNEKLMTGTIYNVNAKVDSEKRLIPIEGFTNTIDLVDSVSKPPYKYVNKTLNQILTTIIKQNGNKVKVVDKVKNTFKFKRAIIEPEEKIFDFISKLAQQIGVILTSNQDGNIEIIKTDTKVKSVATIMTNQIIAPNIEMSWNGRERYSEYVELTKRKKKSTKKIEKDELVTRPRYMAYHADELDKDKKDSVVNKKNRTISDSISINLPVNGFYREPGKRWKEGEKVTIQFEELWLKKGMDFLIRSVEFVSSPEEKLTNLGLVLPESYSGDIINEPWDIGNLKMSIYDVHDILHSEDYDRLLKDISGIK